jgi:hypothetical protein
MKSVPNRIFEQLREGTERLKAEGWQVVYPARREAESAGVLREEPPRPEAKS